jgi:hypothetical protein
MACGCGCGAASPCGAPPFSRPIPSPGPQPTPPAVVSDTAKLLPLCGTLARTLVPVADSLRDLFTTFGLRPYVVNIVRTRWSSGKRGVGVEVVQPNPIALLPTPLLTDMSAVTEVNTPIGLDEFGEVLVQQISGRYTDDFLRGLDRDGRPPEPDEQVYYEVEFPPPCEGREGQRRRFVIKGAPMYFAGRFQWHVRLERARQDRARSGDPR